MGAQGGGFTATKTVTRNFGIYDFPRRLLLVTLSKSFQGKIVVPHEFLAALLAVQAVLLQVALDAFARDIRVGTHEFHYRRGAGMLQAYVENGRNKIPVELQCSKNRKKKQKNMSHRKKVNQTHFGSTKSWMRNSRDTRMMHSPHRAT